MKITITPEMLCTLCAPKFTLSACKAICELLEDGSGEYSVGDICLSYQEIPQDWVEEEPDNYNVITILDNGLVLVAN